MIQRPPTRKALAISAVLHAVIVAIGWRACDRPEEIKADVVDIELAPVPPPVEALPEEVAQKRDDDTHAAPAEEPAAPEPPPPPPEEPAIPIDAAPPDAPPDAPPPDAPPPDAPPPDAVPLVALADAGVPDAEPVALLGDAGVTEDAGPIALADAGDDDDAGTTVALADAGVPDDGPQVASVDPGVGSGSGADATGSGSGTTPGGESGSGSGSAVEQGSGAGIGGNTNEPAVPGAQTTPGTAANLLAYFPRLHVVTALIRFDRLRNTEWAAKTERLMLPMPDYRFLFGTRPAKIYDKLDTLVISTPSPNDAIATTLVGRTHLPRAQLRAFLGATSPITWQGSKGGLYGTRKPVIANDRRVFLSPFRGWFLLAHPRDLGRLTVPAQGNLDTIEATGTLPPWLAQIRKIEAESGDDKGPALVATIDLGGKKIQTGAFALALGVAQVQLPDRLSIAMELVPQGWLVRGNLKFADATQAKAFMTQVQTVQGRVTGSTFLESLLGKAAMNVINRLSFSQAGARVSYTTSMSIADTRTMMSVAAQYLDSHFRDAAKKAGLPPP